MSSVTYNVLAMPGFVAPMRQSDTVVPTEAGMPYQ
jgi:hypothetical protein